MMLPRQNQKATRTIISVRKPSVRAPLTNTHLLRHALVGKMASSIHTIYRPLARSRRGKVPVTRSKPRMLSSVSDAEEEPAPEEPVVSEEEGEDDFEPTEDRLTPEPKQDSYSLRMTMSALPELDSLESTAKSHPSRSGSMATVKLQRRARLAEKLREVFDVPGIQEVIAGKVTVVFAMMALLTECCCRDALLAAQVHMCVLRL